VRLTANLKAQTAEELTGRRRALHLAAFKYANAETARELDRIAVEGKAEERLKRDANPTLPVQRWLREGGKIEDLARCSIAGGKVHFTVEGLVDKLQRDCDAVLARHASAAAERFVHDRRYRAMAEEMLATGTSAVSSLRLYLEDHSKQMNTMMRTSLMAGHRGYLGFLENTLPKEAGEARTAAAGRLCQVLGVMEASPDERDVDGLTLLMRAAADGAGARVLRGLVAARADLEARDTGKLRATAIWWAAYQGRAEAASELARLGADVNAIGEPGAFDSTPMLMAAQQGFVEVVEALGRFDADVDRAAHDGCTPVWVAARQGHAAAVTALGRLGADVNLADQSGRTPAWAAAWEGHTAAVEALGGLGADMNLASSTGQTPLGAACARGNTEAAAAVERLGGRKGAVVPDGRASEGIARG
jgi:hypothetical protein